ncbi:hypothetical protein ACFX43_27165 [Nocardioides sp. YIM B13467]|uniref:hypothetical protein n=1 Tax=Nocardioides sp. YIM B13467 TaxID=3366294 RepID=UPI00366B30C4
MSEALHAGAVLPAALGVCCVAVDRRRIAELVAGVVMVLAMVDMALGSAVVAPAGGWAVVLLALAGALMLAERRQLVPPCRHGAFGTALMGVCAALMAVRGHVHVLAVDHHDVGNAHAAGHELALAGLCVVAVFGTAAYLVMTVRELRREDVTWIDRIGAVAMPLSLLLMLAAALQPV